MSKFSYLALGDSYTIGEGVLLHESFPYQVVQMLRHLGLPFNAPEIIARTGWRIDELRGAMDKHTFLDKYHFVSLLIGVNDQYQHGPVEGYATGLEHLIQRSIELADSRPDSVVLVSIPDYSVTPFAATGNIEATSRELDIYNSIGRALSLQYKIHFVDVVPGTRKAKEEHSLLAPDGLHPSPLLYQQWGEEISTLAANCVKK